jgi:hypothetical protein
LHVQRVSRSLGLLGAAERNSDFSTVKNKHARRRIIAWPISTRARAIIFEAYPEFFFLQRAARARRNKENRKSNFHRVFIQTKHGIGQITSRYRATAPCNGSPGNPATI